MHCIKLWYASQIISAIHSSCLLCPFFTIGFAGTAPTVAPAGTSFLTTAPAATIAPSPIWMPPWSWNLQQELINTWGELGKQLLIRGTKGSRKVTLTEEGMLLRKRAEEIFNLVKKRKWDCSLRQCNHRRRVYPLPHIQRQQNIRYRMSRQSVSWFWTGIRNTGFKKYDAL